MGPLRIEAKSKETQLLKDYPNDNFSRHKKLLYKKNLPFTYRATKKSNKKVAQFSHPYAEIGKSRNKSSRRKPRPDFQILLGGLGALRPEYNGSNQYDFRGLPFLDVKYKNIFFLNFYEGLGINVLHAPNFRVGMAFNYYGSRVEDDSNNLRGTQDIGGGFDAGAFGSISFGRFSAKLKFRQDISNNHDGKLLTGRFGYKISLSKKLRANLNLRTTLADDNYMKTYFGVTNVQSAATGLRKFEASSNVKDVGGGAIFMYTFDKHWAIITLVNYSRLLNDAANSPLVEDIGSKNQFWLGLGTAYRF